MDHMYKSRLQTYAMKQNMELPVYASEREGVAHAPRFRSKVTVCGHTFQSQEFFPTLKAAEHAAAKIALASLAQMNPEEIDVAYKNLLQEIAQKKTSLLPVYGTATYGQSHAPTFITTVEFDGKVYKGEEAKTKKMAEMNAAKVAFMSIKYGSSHQTSSLSLPCEGQETANIDVKSSSEQEIPSQSSKMATPDVPSKWIEVYEDELPDVLNAAAIKMNESSPVPDDLANNDKVPDTKAIDTNIAAAAADALRMPQNPTDDKGTLNAPATEATEATEINNAASFSTHMPQNPINDCNETSYVKEMEKKLIMGTGHLSIPTGQHVVCRPWNPEMTLPQNAEMVFRDDRFIAYRLLNP